MHLEIKNIKVHYGKVEAVKGVSVNIEKGTVVSLIGGNGAGKSTILRTLIGLKKPTSGEIWFNGERIDGLPAPQITRKGIGYSMEGRRIFSGLTVHENLEMGAYVIKDKQEIQKRMDEVCALFPILRERFDQKGGTLSGGEQQMLAIARAMMSEPSLILLDEPSLGLAPKIVQELGVLIRDINKMGVSVLLVEQNSKLGLGVADRGYVLEVGEVVLEGDSKELMANDHVKKIYLGV
ncbi:MAG: ABC transporter ATP-binding protein [Syntrophales bacterium]|nr:ABC transporter ATP-binding protein [Syntrophales bacterium]